MKFSIIIPAYNEEKLLSRCLKSILEADLPENFEIIVVNNASTDRTEEVAKSFPRIRVIREERKGVTRARQAGFQASDGDIVAFFDADTIVTKHWFKVVAEKFSNDPRLVGISGPYQFENISKPVRALEWFYNHIIMPAGEEVWRKIFRRGGIILYGGNFAVRRFALETIGGFNTEIEFYGEDTNLTRRIARVGKITFVKEACIFSSPRRFRGDGGIKTTAKYVLNFFGEWILKRPVHRVYRDFR